MILKELWNRYGFALCVGLAVVVLVSLSTLSWVRGDIGTFDKLIDEEIYNVTPIDIPDKPIEGPSSRPGFESKGEKKAREFLESLFQRPFPRVRPDFLKNPVTGRSLELDGYCEDPGEGFPPIAFEYDGIQHSKKSSFHGSDADFQNQQYRDMMKDGMCRERGIVLIRIAHTVKDIPSYLVEELRKAGVRV